MTTTDRLERRLQRIFAYPLDVLQVGQIDARVRALPETPLAPARSRGGIGRRLGRPVFLAAALALALAAVTIGSLTLLERVAHDAEGWGYRIAWDRGTPIGITVQTESGELTIDRGYADANRVILALVYADLDGPRAQRLTDAAGREYRPFGGPGYTELTGEHAELMAWDAPEPIPTGDLTFTVSSHEEMGPDAWSAEFVLPVQGGVTALPEETVEHEGTSVTLHSVSISPTAVHAEVTYLPPDGDRSWVAANLSFTLNGRDPFDSPAWGESLLNEGDEAGRHILTMGVGTEEWSGEWKLRIGELVGFNRDGEGEQVRISGPWEFTFSVP
ncbi:MAG TPA: hypothetical protein VEW95_10520 [Candidatus Limnocylindrales bacterium]|nr:hypothetical protein [Candidatus Limnocylindrales bacterium]